MQPGNSGLLVTRERHYLPQLSGRQYDGAHYRPAASAFSPATRNPRLPISRQLTKRQTLAFLCASNK
nr:hypothetical protein Iba_chr11dCG1840 [Ipomoea batatas]